MILNERVREARQKVGLSQSEFGKRMGVSRSVILNIELKKVSAKNVFVDHMCEVFGINKHWMYSGEGSVFADFGDIGDDFVTIFDTLRPEYRAIAVNLVKSLHDLQNRDTFNNSGRVTIAEE